MHIWAGLAGIIHGLFLMVAPSFYWVKTFSPLPLFSGIEGAMIMLLGIGILFKSRFSALLLFLYVLVAKVFLVIVLRKYFALLPGLFWLVQYYCGILGTFSKK